MMEDADGYDDVRVRRDYAGKQRIVSGRRA
jgi:hypothetical protein